MGRPIHFYLAHGLGIDWIFSQMRIASFKIFANRGRWQNIKVTCGFLQTVELLFSVKRLRQNPSDSLFLSLESPAHLTHQKITLPTKCSHRRPTWPCLSLWVALIRTYWVASIGYWTIDLLKGGSICVDGCRVVRSGALLYRRQWVVVGCVWYG